jgi:hypothetical protein
VNLRLEEIGSNLFKTGSRKHWKDLTKMLLAGQRFIEVNQVKLLANKNMPEDFPKTYLETVIQFQTVYGSFIQKGLDKLTNTDQHTRALNKIYDEVSKMFAVGRAVFKNDKLIKSQFQFSRNLKVISGAGWSGIKGKILDEDGKLKVTPPGSSASSST